MLVLDSADDASVFLDDTSASHDTHESRSMNGKLDLDSILPRSPTGSIIITSRSYEVVGMLTGSESSSIDVGPMNDQDAHALLRKKFTVALKEGEASALVSALDYMPLALTQAAAFINRTPRMSIAQYLEEISHNQGPILDSDQLDIRRDATASSSITTTWQVSFDYLCKRSPSAARLLSLMSLFDRQGIPKALLEGNYTTQGHSSPDFDHDMYMLTSLCFVKNGAGDNSFEMHGLMQFATKRWLERNGKLEEWKGVYVRIINEHFPEGQPENWAVCERLFPHAQAALKNHPLDANGLEAWASISWKAAWYMGERGGFGHAYKLALDALEVREILLDPEDPEIFDSLNSVGVALRRLGRYEESKNMYQRALKAQKHVFGVDHVDTLTSMLNLAQLYGSQEQWIDAEALLQQILGVVTKNKTEPGRSLTLSTLTTLANAHRSLGRYREAADLELQILQARESKLGPDHPTTLAVKGNLAYTYRHLGRLQSAEALNLQILAAQEMNRHAETEIEATKAHLASIHLLQGHCVDHRTEVSRGESGGLILEVTSKNHAGTITPNEAH
jgi:tetratricopeptide (TPR) repeat protein